MSHSKKDRSFPSVTDIKLAQMIAQALHDDFDNVPSAIKHIGLQTGINPRAIKNWFQAKNTPSAANLLMLARVSPAILRIVVEHAGGGAEDHAPRKKKTRNDPINGPLKTNHNKRQLWFLRLLRAGSFVTARHIQEKFGVNMKTAKRDIAELKSCGTVTFIGAKKNGHYALT